MVKIYQNGRKILNDNEIFCTNLNKNTKKNFRSKAFQNKPKFVFWVCKYLSHLATLLTTAFLFFFD
jgi:hypothetical protein